MSDKTIYDKLNLVNQKTNDIKQTLVDYELTTPDEATLENLPIIIGDFLEKSGGINPYEQLYMQRTANETSMVGLFAYTPASTTLDLSKVNTSKVTDMSYMFNYCKVPYLDLSGFDVSNVSNMDHMFYYCTSEINIDGWDTSKLTNANYMFSSFTNGGKYLDLSVLDFSNVIKADSMFDGCNIDYVDIRNLNLNLAKLSSLPFRSVDGTVLDLSNYDITGLKRTYNLVYFCDCPTVDLTNWKTTEVTDMGSTFYYNSNLERLIMPDWDMTNVTKTSSFIYSCGKLNYIDLSRSNDTTIAKIATLVPAKTLTAYGQILIPVDSSQANIEALAAKYWKPVGPRIDMTSCKIDPELNEIKPGKSTKLYYNNPEPWYGNDVGVEYVLSDESVATIDQENKTITSTGIEGSTEIIARIADTQEVISEPFVFSVSETDNYPNVIKFRGTSTPTNNNYIMVNGTNVKLSAMNYNSASGIYTYDVGAPITSIQFNGHSATTYANTCTDLIKINTSNVTDMIRMFYSCSNLTELDLSSWDTSNVTNMGAMFYSCSNLTELDLSSWDTSNVTNMADMFYYCSNLTSLDVSSFDTSKVTNMSYMFQSCYSLHTLRLDNCSNATISKIITSYGFPTGTIEGITRKIYFKKAEAAGLTEPTNWVFEFID
jgi:surface protein